MDYAHHHDSRRMSDCFIFYHIQLPASHAKLKFSNIICGVLRGALEMVQMRVECQFVKDTLLGDATTEIRMKLCEILEDQAPPSDD